MEHAFHIYNKMASDGVAMSTDKLLRLNEQGKTIKTTGAGTSSLLQSRPPVVVCVGSDLAIGDSLGPIVGSMLKFKTQGLNVFLYGTLAAPVTAKEIRYVRTFLKETHSDRQVIAIDAAVGDEGDIGLIKINDTPLMPGAGANKQLGSLGDISIMGVVAEKSLTNYGLLNTTRLNLVYAMAEIISDGLAALLWERCARQKEVKKDA
ncbi:MAG: spore protease YyaC [Clostridiales bacterium]|nr:spore protease YyaC [Clostridiales bacterium]